jgi:uncharacterized protein (DUF1499 family)
MPQATQPSPLVNWIGYLAITLLLVLPLSVLTVRSGAWQQGLLLYALSCLGSLLLLALAGFLLLIPKYKERRGAIGLRMLAALPGSVLLVSLMAGRGDYPPIHDITTDTGDPPRFVTAEKQRGEGTNPLDIKADTIAAQREAYPDIQTLMTDLPIDQAFDRAVSVAGELGWEIYHQDRSAGVIEAVDTTTIMAFKDDVVIRLRTNADGTLVDMRSVSRVGIGDIGANASRIRAFQDAF